MKKFIGKVLILGAFFVPLAFVYSVVVDPYNVFHYKNIRDNGVGPNQNYIKMRYLLDNPDKFDSFVFGSSRVSRIDVAGIDSLHCYNMTYSGGLPLEHFENIETLINSSIIPNTIVVGVDEYGYFKNPEIHKNDLSMAPYPGNTSYIKFLIKYLNPAVLSSLDIILFHKKDEAQYRKQFYENGGKPRTDNAAEKNYNWEKAIHDVPNNRGIPEYGIENAIADIQKIIDICRKHTIKLIIFTNPLHIAEYQHAVQYGYFEFLTKLADITNFYNFSSSNDIAVNNIYFYDVGHYNSTIGDMVIDTIFNGISDEHLLSQGFGVFVTPENRDAFFALLWDQEPR